MAIKIKMIAIEFSALRRPSITATAAFILLAALATIGRGEELKDVWHYDLGIAKINKTPSLTSAHGQQRDHSPGGNKLGGLPASSQNASSRQDDSGSGSEPRCDFRGRRLRVAVASQPPFVSCHQDLYGDWLCNGSNIELIYVLEQRLNFKADWVVLANNHLEDGVLPLGRKSGGGGGGGGRRVASAQRVASNTSVPAATGTAVGNLPQPSGIFSLVSTGRVLLSANGVMKTMDRSGQNLIVSEPFDSFRLHFLLSKSVRDHDHIFIKPFNANAWLAILSSAVLVVPVFYFINTTSAYYATRDDRHLARVSLRQCWEHCARWAANTFPSRLLRAKRSLHVNSTDVLLEDELGKIMELRALTQSVPEGAPISTIESSLFVSGLARRIPAPLLRGESKRKRRLVRRQWAYERRRAKKLSKLKHRSGFFNVAYVIWYVVASLANQGGETEDLPRADSTRILVAFWWLYMIVICAIHSGILTAILTFPKQNDFIQTLDDYLNLEPRERASLRLTVDKYSELAHLLIDSDNLHKSPLQELQKQRAPIAYVNFQRNHQRVLDEVQLGQSAFVEEKSFIAQIISHDYYDSKQTKCLFKASRYPIDVIPMSLLLSDRMPRACVDSINGLMRRVMLTGLAQKWRRKYESLGNDCLNTVVINAGDVDKIELKHVILAFWLLALGASIGLLFLALEVVWLFTVEDDDDDDEEEDEDDDDEDDDHDSSLTRRSSGSSSSSLSSSLVSTTSNESDKVKLGFRRALMPQGNQIKAIRSLKARQLPARTILRKTKRNQKRTSVNTPKITFALEGLSDSSGDHGQETVGGRTKVILVVDEREGLKEVREYYTQRSRERRHRRMAMGAERRARRVKKTMDLVRKIHGGKLYSERVKSRIRRMSHSIANHLHPSRVTAVAGSTRDTHRALPEPKR